MVVLFLWLIILVTFFPIRIKVKSLVEVAEFIMVTNVTIGVLNFPFEITMNEDDKWLVVNKKSRRSLRIKNDKNKQENSIKIADVLNAFYARKILIIGTMGVKNKPALVKAIKNGFIMIFNLIENTILRSFNEKACFLYDLYNSSNCEIQVEAEFETSIFRIIFALIKIIFGRKYGHVRSKKINQKSA